MTETQKFRELRVGYVDVGTARIAYRMHGEGPPLLLIHGWPFSGLTWRKLLPCLAPYFTCYVPDLPGAGDTEWTAQTPFDFGGQAQSLRRFVDGLGLEAYSLMAHDTGATIARLLAVDDPRLRRLLLLNTEMPFHRPPWIPTYRVIFKTPWLRSLSTVPLGLFLRSAAFRRSPMGYGSCFDDSTLLDADFFECFLQPLLRSRRRRAGHARYLAGIDWHLIDGLRELHGKLKQPVRLVWGVNDTTFPVGLAKKMSLEFADSRGLREIEKAKLLVHEEQPARVAQEALTFFTESAAEVGLTLPHGSPA